ncbi:SO2930 family diheme c-type cytochrome [Jiulongibacter sediminis]|uniref:Lipoprotein n=1 Tax=Jiulongibacter sediminis TaxID=1605367 RepID=A0A0N8HAG9_9BACT|nr:SO2930 family diheme c-type cytochrome [Jiulongibacter sediminis]KPM50140.1 lipoprotein [Jiulongibacter sediminis]
MTVSISSLWFFLSLFWTLPEATPKAKLSDYGFFQGVLAEQIPAGQVYPYSLQTPLFTDYAEKLRFVYLPAGQKAKYDDKEVLDFPVGSALIKTFYYPIDFRKPQKGRRLIETRVLVHEENGWQAFPYVWNEEQTEAYLEVAGESTEVKYIDLNGKKKKHAYAVPNVNQCKGCHNRNEKMSPIGPSARQLNSDLEISDYLVASATSLYHSGNQLKNLDDLGLITGMPDLSDVPKIVNWQDQSASLNDRARAWLDINCAHCHRPEGPANSSGLFLSIHNDDPVSLGIMKAPVATGRASADFSFDIIPGKADESILVHRMASTDPGVMMPELGRKTVHEESLQLIRNWINSLP